MIWTWTSRTGRTSAILNDGFQGLSWPTLGVVQAHRLVSLPHLTSVPIARYSTVCVMRGVETLRGHTTQPTQPSRAAWFARGYARRNRS